MRDELRRLVDIHGIAAIAKSAGASWRRAYRAIRDVGATNVSIIQRLAAAAVRVDADSTERGRTEAELIAWVRERAAAEGLTEFARRCGQDARNLAKVFRAERRPSLRADKALRAKAVAGLEVEHTRAS